MKFLENLIRILIKTSEIKGRTYDIGTDKGAGRSEKIDL